MKIDVLTNLGLSFLTIAKEYAEKKNEKEKLMQAIKIIIFTATAAEALANREGSSILKGKDLKQFIKNGNLPKNNNDSIIKLKWQYLLKNTVMPSIVQNEHLCKLEELIKQRNMLVHFKPKKNLARVNISRETGKLKIIKNNGVYKLTLKVARNHFKNFDELFFSYCKARNIYPDANFSNTHWGSKSPFAWIKKSL